MSSYRIKLWNNPIFQIPLICFGLCLVAAALFWLLGFGRPQVAVAIALDLSNSTYDGQVELFNSPGTVLSQEIEAVQAYLKQNNGKILRSPNQVKVFGFGGIVKPLTGNFETNSDKVEQSFLKSLDAQGLVQEIDHGYTDINLAIKTASNDLKNVSNRCRELILVTDGQADVSPDVIDQTKKLKVKINSVVVGGRSISITQCSFSYWWYLFVRGQ